MRRLRYFCEEVTLGSMRKQISLHNYQSSVSEREKSHLPKQQPTLMIADLLSLLMHSAENTVAAPYMSFRAEIGLNYKLIFLKFRLYLILLSSISYQ